MLAGRPPFVGPTAVSIAMQHASTNPPLLRQFNPSLPISVERVVMRALEKEPEERFHSAIELQQALRACLRELVQQGHPAVASPWQGLASPAGGGGSLFPPQRQYP
jgi:serine/threonine-protein kinase